MKSSPLFFSLFLITITSVGQINFEKGYFIDNDGKRTDCLIKNQDWKNNPSNFFYKIEGNDTLNKESINSVKEFSIDGVSKFVRADVKIDRSGDLASEINYNKEPVWTNEQLFLQVLVEGKATLYSYKENSMTRFFYSVDNSSIQQLIYKKYLIDYKNNGVTLNSIKYNFGYRQQLFNYLKCTNQDGSSLKSLEYKQKQLEKFFKIYNGCSGSTSIVFEPKRKGGGIHLRVTPGLNYSSLSIKNNYITSTTPNGETYDFGKKLNYRIGIEAEITLPFNRNKWAVLFEPTYQFFNSKKKVPGFFVNSTETITIKSSSIDFPIGLRHSFFLSENSKIFVNAHVIQNFAVTPNSFLQVKQSKVLPISFRVSFAFGGGISYKRYSTELRYYTNRGILNGQAMWSSEYTRIAIILGYKLF